MQRSLTNAHRTALLREALEIMSADYGAPLALDDVARRIATSRRQLQRCFEELGRTTFRSALTRIRMRAAAELLTATALPIRDVANQVGYRQPAQFAKTFRRQLGIAPAEYRILAGRQRYLAAEESRRGHASPAVAWTRQASPAGEAAAA